MRLLEFNSFKVEKILESLLLESNVVYSSKFKSILRKLPDDKIARKLLELENADLTIISNFFDIHHENEDEITFTPDRIAQTLLGKKFVKLSGRAGGWLTNNIKLNHVIFTALGYVLKEDGAPVYRPGANEIGEIISETTSEKTKKVWCYVKFDKGEGVYNKEKLVDAITDLKISMFQKHRQGIRLGRGVRTILRAAGYADFVDADIEKFGNDFKAIVKIMNDVFSRFEIVEGDALGFWYHRKNYLEQYKGSLGSSCQAPGRLDWLEIYIKNPQTVKLLILRSEENWDKICGRVLLWYLEDGKVLMDYIYVNKDADKKIFMEYAEKNKWVNRDKNYNESFTAYLNPGTFAKYPSVDTMNQWDPKTGKISNKNFTGSRPIIWSNDGDDDDDDDDGDWDDDDY